MIKETLEKLLAIAENPKAQIESYKTEGKRLAGIFPEYAPEPIVAAAGFVPFGMWGSDYLVIKNADTCFPNFGCSLMRSNVELGLAGYTDDLDFIIAPILCDALKGAVQCFRTRVKTPMLPFSLPQNRKSCASEKFTAEEFKALSKKIEAVTGCQITEENISKQIVIYNKHTKAMQDFAELAAEHTDIITPVYRWAVFKSARFMTKEEHLGYVEKINEELMSLPKTRKNKIGIILTGVTSGSLSVMKLFEELKVDIIADNVYEDSWSYIHTYDENNDPYAALAAHWNKVSGSCICHEGRGPRYEYIKMLADKYKADGLIISLMKFCDPEEYEAVPLKKCLEEKLPVIVIEADQNSDNAESTRTKLEAFVEIIG